MDNYEYDIDVDALSIDHSAYNYAYSIEITSDLIIDVDNNKNVIGVELLNASKILNVDPQQLINPKKISVEIIKREDNIILSMNFKLINVKREFKILTVEL